MTTHELYDQAIKPLHPDERLHIAKRMLDDLAPDALPDRPNDVHDFAHLEQLLLDGLASGSMIEANADFRTRKEQRMIDRLCPA